MTRVDQVDISNIDEYSNASRFIKKFMDQVIAAMNKGLTPGDNFQASIVNVTFPTTANQNFPIAHKLSVTPIGYFPIRLSAAGSVYDGSSLVLGATFVNLKCNVAGLTATIMFF